MPGPPPSLSPADYVDPAVYQAEVVTVLRAAWLPVGRADQVAAPGDHIATTLLGTPLVVTRGDDHRLRVLANVCAHRASTLVDDGAGHSPTLVCPYHRWAYRLDGSFVGGPLTEGSDLGGVCLPELRHIEWLGFVLVDLSGQAADPAGELASLAAHIAPWRWDELVTVGSTTFDSAWNWKVMVENWIECYHHLGAHRDSIEPFQPARATEVVPDEGGPWVAMTVDGVEGMEGDADARIPGLTLEQARRLSVWAAFPLLLAGSLAGYAFWLQLQLLGPRHHRVTWHLLAHRDHRDRFSADVVQHHLDVLTHVHREDMEACARVQRGLESGLLSRFRLVDLEAPIVTFQRWVATSLGSR